MATRYFQFIEIEYDKLTEQINSWLRYTYNKSDIVFNSASPYGQIINVLKELFQHNLLYLKYSMKMLDIETTTNKKVIQSIARIAGHSVGRAISATGTLRFKLKIGIDYKEEIGGTIIIPNRIELKNKSNSLSYIGLLNQDYNHYSVNLPDMEFYLPIIQGKDDNQIFTGDGTINQSYSVNIPNQSQIENFNYTIKYNSIVLEKKDSLWDMLPGEKACYIRSGYNGGIDIYFGTNHYGFVPQVGSRINVEYVLSDGSLGEILIPTINDWKIEGEITDGDGETIEIIDFFDIFVENDINFSSNGETTEFTKSIVPYVSRNFVLATPKQFIFHLSRMNLFSKVNAFNMLDDNNYAITDIMVEQAVNNITKSVSENKSKTETLSKVNSFKSIYNKYKTNMNDNKIYLYLIPDITKYFNNAVNYFNISTDVFSLDDLEKQKTITFLRTMGTLSISTAIDIIQPKISRYVMHVYVRRHEDSIIENIRQEIIETTSSYLLNNQRFDRIPKSDFISLYKDVNGIDSVSIYFVSEKNENFHIENDKINKESNIVVKNGIEQKEKIDTPLGIDSVHGDIIIDKDEYVIIRGGFRDRNGIWYAENPNDNSLSSINITFDGVTEK